MTLTPETIERDFKRAMLGCLPSLRAFAVSLCKRHDYADDLVQDTIMKAWAKKESFQHGTNMKAWLFTILRNEFYSQARKSGREIQDSDGYFTEQLANNPGQHGVLEKLPDDQREAIILVGASGFAYEEAAVICGCAVGTIKSRVNRARTRLAELLKISGDADFGPDSHSLAVTSRTFARF
jgi:RNA polymerase sigma-70 factor (ECF subfamily)